MCEFRIGQKVVCVDAGTMPGHNWHEGDPVPVVGGIYTVTGIIDANNSLRGPFALIIRELPRGAWALSKGYLGYNSSRFRPLVTDDSRYDISIFLRICSDVSKGKSRVTVEGVRS